MTFAEAPSRARKAVKKGNILVSTVRPNLNAVAIVEDATPNTTVASTGFCVLDCKENVDKRFVLNFCKSKAFIDEMVAQATGASYPAVSDKIVRAALVPSYSFHDQIKIGEILDKVSLIIANSSIIPPRRPIRRSRVAMEALLHSILTVTVISTTAISRGTARPVEAQSRSGTAP